MENRETVVKRFADELKAWENDFMNVDLKTIFYLVLSNGQFSGSVNEDPHMHLTNFQQIFNVYKHKEIPEGSLRLRLFPLSLNGNARSWFKSLEQNSTITWNEVEQQFLMKYFPAEKTAKYIYDIANFAQFEEETIYETWKRFKELRQMYPCSGFPEWIWIHMFYNGLLIQNRRIVDAAAGGTLMNKSYNEAYMLLDEISRDNKCSSDKIVSCMEQCYLSLNGR